MDRATTVFRILNYAVYAIPISMLLNMLITGKTLEQLIIPTTVLLILIITTFEILYNKNVIIPKDLCNELIKTDDIKNTYAFNKKCHDLASKIFYLGSTISFSILFIIYLIYGHNIIIQLMLLIITIISVSKTSISEVRKIIIKE